MEKVFTDFFDFHVPTDADEITKQLISKIQDNLREKNFYCEDGTDEVLRPGFVGLQNIFEQYLVHLLVTKRPTRIQAFIHTPKPATPLCVFHNKTTDEFRDHAPRENTVQSRVMTINQYLNAGGKLFAIYTEKGLEDLKNEDKTNFTNNLELFKENIINVKIKSIESDQIGAFYVIDVDDKSSILFSLKAYQRDDSDGKREWSVWYGHMDSPSISQRASLIQKLLIKFLEEKNVV